MAYARDPLSVRYDAAARQVLIRAIRASRNGQGVTLWIASTRAELRNPDAGGRSAHERAFSRAAYYDVWRRPINAGTVPDWSLKLTWGDELKPSGQGRLARPVRVRVWPRSQARVRGPRWADNDELRSGGIGSGWERFNANPANTRTKSYRQKLARERQREKLSSG